MQRGRLVRGRNPRSRRSRFSGRRINLLHDGFLNGNRPPFDRSVEVHEQDVSEVGDDHEEALVPEDLLVNQDEDQDDDGQAVGEAISGDRVPVDGDFVSGEESADGDDAEDVEDGAADDGADAEVALRHEGSHDVGEEFGRARAWMDNSIL